MKKHSELAQIFIENAHWETIGDDTQYRILYEEDEVVIAFYGSNSEADWKNNFNFLKTPYKNMPTKFYVHRGFLGAWKLINDFFLELVRDIDRPITIIGHSYGAAIATLCMEDLYFNYPEKRDKLRLVTFGSPRIVGFWNFRKVKERWNNTSVYNNALDIVTRVPFVWMGFRHVKKMTRLKNKSWLHFIRNHEISEYKKEILKGE